MTAEDPFRPKARKVLVIVADAPEVDLSVYYAARRAKHAGGRVSLACIIEPSQFEHWMSVEATIRREAYETAEALLSRAGQQVIDEAGVIPELIIREGPPRAELRALLAEDPDISVVVVGASSSKDGPGPLVTALSTSTDYLGKRPVPIVIIPGAMTREEIYRVA